MRIYRLLLAMVFFASVIGGCGASHDVGTAPSTADAIIPSTVSAIAPEDGEMGVHTNRKIVATFSADMDPPTVTAASFTLTQGTAPVLGTVTYVVARRTATFTPTSDLLPNTVYTVTITNEATTITVEIEPTDMGANGQTVDPTMAATKVVGAPAVVKMWTFTTGEYTLSEDTSEDNDYEYAQKTNGGNSLSLSL